MADITGSIHGIRLELEVKVGRNTMSPLQEQWLREQAEKGCIAFCAWSMAAAKDYLSPFVVDSGGLILAVMSATKMAIHQQPGKHWFGDGRIWLPGYGIIENEVTEKDNTRNPRIAAILRKRRKKRNI